MDYTLEVIVLPVTDIDRSRDFYRDKAGFQVDLDTELTPGVRIVQLTPPGSGCSIVLADGLPSPTGTSEPGTYHGLQLVVADIQAAHAELRGRGLDVTEPRQLVPGDSGTFMYFTDPDGNGWAIQGYRPRLAKPLHVVLAEGRD